ncbi:efflux RND transporter periplasmic adaptor subunit [Pseudomonas sp. RL_15y_Pfl2_60]|uniref:efflux RND transporter periplasmic adaptor subunit n=1 Tax=Pseudomonas sp. RL_15y_Pfl2_60 TaxID=3088709 RepID=UPI0030D8EE4B
MTIYLTADGQPLQGNSMASVKMLVKRPNGAVSTLEFKPENNRYVSSTGIAEPHYFTAQIEVTLDGITRSFEFNKQEGKIELTDEQLKAGGIELVTAAPGELSTSISLPGEIRFDENRTAHVVPRVAGVVESVAVTLGQKVKKGELLAVITSQQVSEQRSEFAAAQRRAELARTTYKRERQLWQDKISAEQDYLQAKQDLQEAEIQLNNARQKVSAISGSASTNGGSRYELRAPFDGSVVEKHIVLGEVVSETSNTFTISDLSEVWATFNISPKDLNQVQVGKRVKISAPELGTQLSGEVSYVGSLLGEQTRTATARVTVKNPQGAWRPGLFVSVLLATQTRNVGITLPEQAIQTVEEQPAVFVRVDGGFIAQPIVLGARDSGYVEISEGLAAGAEVASVGSFTLKSELGKSSAQHAH